MSQIIKNGGGGGGPTVPTEFTTDLEDTTIIVGDIAAPQGSAVPAANILRLSGDDGIKTVSTPNAETNNVTVRFIRGRVTTSGAVTENLITQATLSDTTMTIQIIVAGFASDNAGVGAYGTAVVKNIAGVASLVGTVDLVRNRDESLEETNITVTVAGANLLVNVLGVAGLDIEWGACLPGITVSEP